MASIILLPHNILNYFERKVSLTDFFCRKALRLSLILCVSSWTSKRNTEQNTISEGQTDTLGLHTDTQMDLLEDQAYLRATTIILLTIQVNTFCPPHIHPVREDMCTGNISSNPGMWSSNLYPGFNLDVINTRVESLGPGRDNQHLRTHDTQEDQWETRKAHVLPCIHAEGWAGCQQQESRGLWAVL